MTYFFGGVNVNRKLKGFLNKFKYRVSQWVNDLGCLMKANAGRITTTELVNRIYIFCELYSDRKLFPYQEQFSKRIIRSVLENDGDEITALFSRQSGKSETVSVTVGGLMILLPLLANMPMFANDPRFSSFKEGIYVGIFAPIDRQAKITYNRIKSRIQSKTAQAVLESPEFNLGFTTSNGQTVALSNGSFVTAISASEGSSIEGESFMLIICEECQDISNFKIRKSIHPMGAAYNASIIKIGTATTFKGDFYEAIQRNKKEAELKSTHRKNHFEYDYKVASKYNPKYAKYVEKEMKRLGENSDEFRMAYKLEWIIERGMFIDVSLFEQNNTEPLLERSFYDKNRVHVAGIDLGGKGDSTIITIVEVCWDIPAILESRIDPETGEEEVYQAYNTYIKDWCCISNEPDYEEQYVQIVDYLSHFNIAKVVCDATREASVSHRLKANTPYEVIPYIFTTKSKSELYKHLEKEITSQRARVPAGESTVHTREYKDFLEQLGDLQKGYSGTNLVVSHPDEKNAHDDYPDSWALAVFGCAEPGETNNTQTSNNPFNRNNGRNQRATKQRNRLTARRRY